MPVGIDLTAMVDVVFLLIIFFMVSTTFISLETGLPVDLPQAQTAEATPSDLPTVTVTPDERVFIGGTQVEPDALAAILQQLIADTGRRPSCCGRTPRCRTASSSRSWT
jgi:biopolymer transport protein ExbD